MVTTSLPFLGSQTTLHEAYYAIKGDAYYEIPLLVWLLENPRSPIPFPGKIDLYSHDCLHILLNRYFTLEDEAFIVGFTMSNDICTKPWHIRFFKLVSSYLYPQSYRFHQCHWQAFDEGVQLGYRTPIKNIKCLDFRFYQNESLTNLRRWFGLDRLFANKSNDYKVLQGGSFLINPIEP